MSHDALLVETILNRPQSGWFLSLVRIAQDTIHLAMHLVRIAQDSIHPAASERSRRPGSIRVGGSIGLQAACAARVANPCRSAAFLVS